MSKQKMSRSVTIVVILFFAQHLFAGATEDLWEAIRTGNTQAAIGAIAAGADIEAKDFICGTLDGKEYLYAVTPILMAGVLGSNDLIKALFKAGANVNFVATVSIGGDNASTSKICGKGKARIPVAEYENTSWSLAANNGHPDSARLLLKFRGLWGLKN